MSIHPLAEGRDFPPPQAKRTIVSVHLDAWQIVIPEKLARGEEVLVPSVPSSLAIAMSEFLKHPIHVRIDLGEWYLLLLPTDRDMAVPAEAHESLHL